MLNKTESAIFLCKMYVLLATDPSFQNLFTFTTTDVNCYVAAVHHENIPI